MLDNSTTENATDLAYQFYQTEQLIFLSVLFAMIVIGNTLVLTAIFSSGKRRSRMNVFIINLACADLSVAFLSVLLDIIWKVTITWYAGNVMCKTLKFSQCVATYAATYSLVALSIDRFDAIARPMKIGNTEKHCRILVGLAWTFAIIFSTPMFFLVEVTLVSGKTQCWITGINSALMWQVYLTLVSLAVFIIPAIIIASCYIIIVVIIWSKSSKFKGASPSPKCPEKKNCLTKSGHLAVRFSSKPPRQSCMSGSSSRGVIPKAKIKTIKMTFVIVLAFILCWSPYFIWDLLDVYGHIRFFNDNTTVAISTFIQSLAPLNSAANPLIYMLFNTAICTSMFRKHTSFSSPPASNTGVYQL